MLLNIKSMCLNIVIHYMENSWSCIMIYHPYWQRHLYATFAFGLDIWYQLLRSLCSENTLLEIIRKNYSITCYLLIFAPHVQISIKKNVKIANAMCYITFWMTVVIVYFRRILEPQSLKLRKKSFAISNWLDLWCRVNDR